MISAQGPGGDAGSDPMDTLESEAVALAGRMARHITERFGAQPLDRPPEVGPSSPGAMEGSLDIPTDRAAG